MLRSILLLSTSSAPVLAGLVAASAIGARAATLAVQKRLVRRSRRATATSAPSLELVRADASTAQSRRKKGIGAPCVSTRMVVVVDPGDLDLEVAKRVIPFVESIADLPLAEWLMIGRSVAADEQRDGSRFQSQAILEATIADRRLGVAAWHVRDGVRTAAFYATDGASPLSRSERRDFAVSRVAAEQAALALLALPFLADADFEILHAPFASRISAAPKSSPGIGDLPIR